MSASKVASIRALQELQGIVISRKNSKYTPLLQEAEKKCRNKKTELCSQIERQIEEYAVAKFAQYGVSVVPICHRNTSYKNDDLVRPELRVKNFMDDSAEREYRALKEEEIAANKMIDDWYFQAVQSVAAQADLPITPEF